MILVSVSFVNLRRRSPRIFGGATITSWAAGNRCLDQFIGPGLANGADGLEEPSAVPACHGSEAEFQTREPRIAERRVFHGVFLSCESALQGLVTSAAGLPSLAYSRTIHDDQNQ